MDDTAYQPPFIEGRRRRSSKKRIIISSIVVLVLVLVGIGGFQMFAGSVQEVTPTPTPSPTVVAFPTDTPTPTPDVSPTLKVSPSPTAKPADSSVDPATKLDRKALSVRVENGSGTAGAGSAASDVLKNVGYTVVSVGNADAFTYEDVTISVKAEKAAYLPLLKKDLSSEYTVGATSSTLASGSADAVVIIGK